MTLVLQDQLVLKSGGGSGGGKVDDVKVDGVSVLDESDKTAYIDLTGKVDKTNEANQVYVTDGSGNQTHYTLSTNALNNTFVYRSSNAQVRVNLTPSGNNDATSKKYVNDQDALKVDKTNESLKIYGTDELGNQVAYNKEEVGQIIQVETLPTADATNINKIYQYIGETNQKYTNGVFYKNVAMTTTEQWVSFEPSTIAGTICTCSYENFRAWLDTIFALDPLEVASGHFGFYSGTPDTGDARYSVSLKDAHGHFLKSISEDVSTLEAAGFTFDPYLSAQDGLDYTCAVDKQVTSYSWTPIYVQKGNILFIDWGAN